MAVTSRSGCCCRDGYSDMLMFTLYVCLQGNESSLPMELCSNCKCPGWAPSYAGYTGVSREMRDTRCATPERARVTLTTRAPRDRESVFGTDTERRWCFCHSDGQNLASLCGLGLVWGSGVWGAVRTMRVVGERTAYRWICCASNECRGDGLFVSNFTESA